MGELTGQQRVALRALRANHGTGTTDMVSMEGIYSAPVTLAALVRRGLIKKVGPWRENEGYEYELTPDGWEIELGLEEKAR